MIHGEFFDLSGKVFFTDAVRIGKDSNEGKAMAANRMNAVVICFTLLMPSFYPRELMTYHAKFPRHTNGGLHYARL